MQDKKFRSPIGWKFNADGSIRLFPGNTIICFVQPDSVVYQKALWVQEQLQGQPFAHKFALLPPSSFHMTVMQLLCDQTRSAEYWSAKLALDAALEDTDEFFVRTMPAVPAPPGFRMQYWRLKTWGDSVGMLLLPADDGERAALAAYRDAVAAATGVRFPDHDSYRFHITLAYQLFALDEAEQDGIETLAARVDETLAESFGIFETGEPELTFFDDMLRFVPASERHTLASRRSQ